MKKIGVVYIVVFAFLLNFKAQAQAQAQADKPCLANETENFLFQKENLLRLITIGEQQLAIRYQEGEGVPVIFIHGSWDDHHSWLPVAQALKSLEVKNPLLVYDRRGHGAASPDIAQGSILKDVEDLAQLIEKLDIDKAHIVGHSYGANIAIQFALLYPDSVKSLVLYEPPIFGLLKENPSYQQSLTTIKSEMLAAKALLNSGSIEEGTIHFIEKVAFGEGSWENLFDARARSTMLASYRTWLDQSNDVARLNIQPENLINFSGKITLIGGDDSLVVYPNIIIEMKNKVPKATTRQIEEAGHGGLISHKKETAQIIKNHLLMN